MRQKGWQYWPPEAVAQAKQMYADGASYYEIADALGRTYEAVRNKLRPREEERVATVRAVADYPGPDPDTAPLAEVFAPEASRDETDEEFLERFLKVARRQVAKAEVQHAARIRIPSDLPIALCISSDWHVSTGSDMDGLFAMADYVAKTPSMYAIAVGDLFDNPIKHTRNTGAVPDELRAMDLVVGRFRGKLLGTTTGNHDDWSKHFSGIDNIKLLAQRHRMHYAPDMLVWTVEIVAPHDPDTVTATYTIATRHQWHRNSGLNPTHACKTWLQSEVGNWDRIPDVLAIGHNHIAATGAEQYNGKDIHFLRMGAWQRDSAYARAIGFPGYRPTAPTVVLPPEQGRIVAFADPQDATTYMRGWRDVAA